MNRTATLLVGFLAAILLAMTFTSAQAGVSDTFEINGFRAGYYVDQPIGDTDNLYLNVSVNTAWQVDSLYVSFGPDWKDSNHWRYEVSIYGLVTSGGPNLRKVSGSKSIRFAGWDMGGGFSMASYPIYWDGSLNPLPNEVSTYMWIAEGGMVSVDFQIQDWWRDDDVHEFSANWNFVGYGGGDLGGLPSKGIVVASVQPIPEPATLALMSTGSLLMMYRRKRRQK